MKLFFKMSLTLLLLYAAPATAQYIGSSRPLGRAQTLDSLAAKADTQSVRVLEQRADSDSARIDTLEQRSIVDSTRLDSVAVASAAEDTLLENKAEADSGYLHTRIDSVRDNAGGGGGGGATPLDTLFYDYILGFTAIDSQRAGGYSKYIDLDGSITAADSNDADTLIWCIDQIKATGGRIYICGTPADTIYWFAGASFHDSLPSSGGIDGTIIIDADGMDRVIHTIKDKTGYSFYWTADRHAGIGGAKLIWRNQQFFNQRQGYTGANYVAFHGLHGSQTFQNCRLIHTVLSQGGGSVATAAGDSTLMVENCVMGSYDLSSPGGVGGLAEGHVIVRNCTGNFAMPDTRTGTTGRIFISGNVFRRCREITAGGTNSGFWEISNNIIHFYDGSGAYEGITMGSTNRVRLFFNQLYGPSDGSVANLVQSSHSYTNTDNNYYEYGGFSGGKATNSTFMWSATGVIASGNSGYFKNNHFHICTTGLNVNGKTGLVVDGNVFAGCTTDISGSPAVDTDNNSL